MSKSLIGMTASIIIGLGILAFLFLDSNVDSSNGDQTGPARTAATGDVSGFSGKVVSAAGSLVIGGEVSDPGHPVVGATVYLVPTTAMDFSTQMTASAIYEAPYPAEAYDEPLEDAIRLKGTEFLFP